MQRRAELLVTDGRAVSERVLATADDASWLVDEYSSRPRTGTPGHYLETVAARLQIRAYRFANA